MSLTLQIISRTGAVLASARGETEAALVYAGEYREGDRLLLASDTYPAYVTAQLEASLPLSFAFLREREFSFPVPFGEKRTVYAPEAFGGSHHFLFARYASKEEIAAPKDLALNPLDHHENTALFPHASANVETRGEAVFAARNAIDGLKANKSHGEWPFTSWGINRDPNAAWRLEFGRTVRLTEAVVYLRADFPHDAWWEKADLRFSDGSLIPLKLEKTGGGQRFAFAPRDVEWAVLENLIKADDPSPFPALTQLELYGTEHALENR